MSNLIVTIVAIGILTAFSVVGFYYGGTAYMESRNEAHATTLISQATEIASAWKSWSRDHGGSTGATTASTATVASLANFSSYLSAIPVPNANMIRQSGGSNNNGAFLLFDRSYTCGATVFALDSVMTELSIGNAAATNLCKKIADQSSAAPRPRTLCDWSPAVPGAFGCVYDDADASGAMDNAEQKFFVFNVF